MDDALSERLWERTGISTAMERGIVAGCGRGDLGVAPVIHYSSAKNSDKWGGREKR